MGSDQFSRWETRFYAAVVFWLTLYYDIEFGIVHALIVIWPVRCLLVQLRRLGTHE